MGKMTMNGSAGGDGSDECTALFPDVLKGRKAITADSDDKAADGTMPNNGAWTGRIGVNGRAAIPAGYHNGSGYVDQSIPTQAAKTITPGASAQTVSAGRYLTGDITVPGFSLPAANTIKKGTTINIYGRTVTGTFEGWVPTPQDLYYNGINSAGFALASAVFQNTIIKPNNYSYKINFTRNYNVSSYSYLNVGGYFLPSSATSDIQLCYYIPNSNEYRVWSSVSFKNGTVAKLDIIQLTNITAMYFINIYSGVSDYINHVWLS